nr:hypothetical protein [Candidatus Njordarchaeum guaymaensis]
MRLRFIAGSILLLTGFMFHQIGFTIGLSNESLIRGTLISRLSTLPASAVILTNPILLQFLGGIIVFAGTLLCASSLVKVNDKAKLTLEHG